MNLINTFFNVPVFLNSLPQLLWGLVVTIQIGVTSIICGWVGGLFLAVARLYAPAFFKLLIRGYIDIFRSIPLLVLLIVVYLCSALRRHPAVALPVCRYRAVAGFRRLYGRIFRAGIEAVPHGQFEASAALGLSNRNTMVDIILPQAIPHRHSAADQQLHQRDEGHRPCLRGCHAGPVETGNASAGTQCQTPRR